MNSRIRILLICLVCVLVQPTAAWSTQHRLIVSSPEPDGAPCWSPDGETIAFSSKMSGNWEIYTVDAWGVGDVVNFSEHPEVDIYASWSPIDAWIAFTSRRDNGSGGDDMDIWIQSLDGDSLRCLTDHPGYDNFAAFDPSGTRIAFSSDRGGETEIWIMPVADPAQAYQVSTGVVDCQHSCWSPDGQQIAFDGRYHDDLVHNRLFLVPAAGGATEEIPHGLPTSCDPGWSPDGRYLAFGGGDDTIIWDLWAWDFQEEVLIQLTDTRYTEQSPLWNATGTEIVYAAVIDSNKDVWVAYELPFGSSVRAATWGEIKHLFRR